MNAVGSVVVPLAVVTVTSLAGVVDAPAATAITVDHGPVPATAVALTPAPLKTTVPPVKSVPTRLIVWLLAP